MSNFYCKIPFVDHLGKLSNSMYKNNITVFRLYNLHHNSVVHHHSDMLTWLFKIEEIFPTVSFR